MKIKAVLIDFDGVLIPPENERLRIAAKQAREELDLPRIGYAESIATPLVGLPWGIAERLRVEARPEQTAVTWAALEAVTSVYESDRSVYINTGTNAARTPQGLDPVWHEVDYFTESFGSMLETALGDYQPDEVLVVVGDDKNFSEAVRAGTVAVRLLPQDAPLDSGLLLGWIKTLEDLLP